MFKFNLNSDDDPLPGDGSVVNDLSVRLLVGSVEYCLDVQSLSAPCEFADDLAKGVISRRQDFDLSLHGVTVIGGEFLD